VLRVSGSGSDFGFELGFGPGVVFVSKWDFLVCGSGFGLVRAPDLDMALRRILVLPSGEMSVIA
jgi:hypothetical protein